MNVFWQILSPEDITTPQRLVVAWITIVLLVVYVVIVKVKGLT